MGAFGLALMIFSTLVIRVPEGVAAEVVPCGEGDIAVLSLGQVEVSTIDHGLFQGGQRFAVRCGPWYAEAIYQAAIPKISLFIDAGIGRPPPTVPAALAMRLFRLPLTRLFDVEGRPNSCELSVRNYVGLDKRIAAAALASPQWDTRRGRTRTGQIGTFVKQLINQQNLHSELIALVKEFGYHVQVSAVEEVPLCRASDLSLPDNGRDGELVPCGGLIYFQLTLLN